jgi:hypothetical protein
LQAGMSVNDRAYEVYVLWAKEKDQQMKEQAARAIQAVIPKWLERTKEKKEQNRLCLAITQQFKDNLDRWSREQSELNAQYHERSARCHELSVQCHERSVRSHERSVRSHQLTNQLLERNKRRRKLANTDNDISARFSKCYTFDDPLGKTGCNIGVEMDALIQFKNISIEDENASDEEPEFEHDDVRVMDLFVGICDH